MAAPNKGVIDSIADLAGKRIATSFPETTKQYFQDQGIPVTIVTITGSVEIAPLLGIADAIVDLVATGSTLAMNELRPIATVLETRATVVYNPKNTKQIPQVVSSLIKSREIAS